MLTLHFQIHNIFNYPNDPFFYSKEKKHRFKTTHLFTEVFFHSTVISLLRKFYPLNATDIAVLRCMFKFIPVLS